MTVEFAKKTGRALALTSALVAAVSLSAVPSSAYARGWNGGNGGNGWHGGGGWRGGHHGGGAAIGLGILGGVLVGSAIAANSYYPYSYGYGYPYYGYSYPYYSYGPTPYYGAGY